MGADPAAADLAADDLAARLGAVLDGTVAGLTRLSGGASRETWSFDLHPAAGGPVQPLILRRDPPGVPKGMGLEARLLGVAATAGVPVPGVVAASDDAAVLGSAFMVVDRLEGETIPRKLLREDRWATARPRLAAQCGEALARLHAVDPAPIEGLEPRDELDGLQTTLDELGQPHPAFELGFKWLRDHQPDSGPAAIVHGDFRMGNLLVGPEGLVAVLDWELAHAGDPLEDLGWLCVRAWRFGAPLAVGGFGTVEQLVSAYEAAGGQAVDREALRWWEVFGTLRWGIICIMQATIHTSGAVRSVELAAIGRRVCETEHDLLLHLPWGR